MSTLTDQREVRRTLLQSVAVLTEVRRVVDEAPPLTLAQLDRLRDAGMPIDTKAAR